MSLSQKLVGVFKSAWSFAPTMLAGIFAKRPVQQAAEPPSRAAPTVVTPTPDGAMA